MANPKVRVGFIGAGELNELQHYPSVSCCPDAEFYGVCVKSNVENMKRAAGSYNPTVMTTDLDAFLADPKVDIVWIALDPKHQAAITRRALQAGKHVFVEKPMAQTIAECVELGKLAKSKGLRLYTGFNRRYAPAVLDLREIVQKAKAPIFCTYRMSEDSQGRSNDIFKESELISCACHAMDVLALLTESEPVRVSAFEVSFNNEAVNIQFANGAVAQLASTIRASRAMAKERIEIILDNAGVTVEDFVELKTYNVPGWGTMTKNYAGREYPGWVAGYGPGMEWEGLDLVLRYRRLWQERANAAGIPDWTRDDTFAAKYGKFVADNRSELPPVNYMVNKGWMETDHAILKSLRDGSPCHAATAMDGARADAVAAAALESIKTGRVVDLNPADWTV